MSPDRTPPMDPDRIAGLLGEAVGGIEPIPTGLERIKAGITRRRHLHQAGLAVATVAVVAGISVTAISLRSTSSPAPFVISPSESATPSPSSSPVPTATPTSPAALPVPSGFSATSVSAIDASTWWVGGSEPCGTPSPCPALVSTTDAGATFHKIRLPVVGVVKEHEGVTVRFATLRDGWVYGHGSGGVTYLLSTHDGGVSWHTQPDTVVRGLVRVEASGGRVYALVGTQSFGIGSRLYSSPVATDSWTTVATPHPENGYRAGFTAVGRSIWIEGAAEFTGSGQPPRALYFSADRGVTFTTLTDPCAPELGGSFDAHGSDIVWAFCATGMQGTPYLSTDGGTTFKPLAAHGMWQNSTQVAAIDASVAFLYGSNVEVTRDGGRTFATVVPGSAGVDAPVFVGFTDELHGFVVKGDGTLLRSDDAGRTFHAVPVV